MIKTFEQFINENYNEMSTYSLCEEYGAPLFNEVSDSLMYKINNSINEGRIVINNNMIEEGLFDTFAKLLGKGVEKMSNKSSALRKSAKRLRADLGSHAEDYTKADEEQIKNMIGNDEDQRRIYVKIEKLCNDARKICENLGEKEDEAYDTIRKKLNAANDAIKEFSKNTVDTINDIIESAQDGLAAAITTVISFLKSMAEFAKTTMEKIGQGIVLAFSLPIILVYIVYKSVVSLCEKMIDGVKDGAKYLKEIFTNIKDSITSWVKEMLKNATDLLIKACKAIKDGVTDAVKAIGNGFLTIAGIVGQVASDAKDAISDAYDSFITATKEFAEAVKAYIKDKWDTVTKWCKEKATSFAEGVKNVWGKITDKVMNVIGATRDAYNAIKDFAKETVENINKFKDDKQRDFWKSGMKYAVDKWGKDEVSSWLDEF